MKKLLHLFCILGNSLICFPQHETDHWFFGVNSGIDFSSGSPVAVSGNGYNIPEGCASISSPGGSLLFYTDGSQIWNANHLLMPNGNNLHGDISSTQSSMIVPDPGNINQYYVFTTDADGDTGGFKYSVVDITLQSGLGDVTLKNISVQDSVTEKLISIKSASGGGYWILTHQWNSNAFYAYQLTSMGLQAPVISHTGMIHTDSVIQNTYGQMKFNMCGTQIAVAIGYMNAVQIFDFNSNSGIVSNPLTLNQFGHVYGVEFSSDANLLYLTSYDGSGTLLQYNISLPTLPLILASRAPLTVTPDIYGLQMASDGKIYAARSFTSQYAAVINFPNIPGSGCNYVNNGVDLDTAFIGNECGLGLPGFVQTFLKNSLSVTCAGADIEDEWIMNHNIYPNPSFDQFYLDFSATDFPVEIWVTDGAGKFIENYRGNNQKWVVGNHYLPGLYFLHVKLNGVFKVFKLIKA